MNPSKLNFSNYKITGDPDEVDSDQHFSPEISDLLAKTYTKVLKKKYRNPNHLLKLIEKYPRVPTFKNYLTVFYQIKGKKEKAWESNRGLIKEHPDYLFGKLNLAEEYIETGRAAEVPKILGEALDLQALYPERKVFHTSEFKSFFNVVAEYLLETDQIEALVSRMEMAEEVLGKLGESGRMFDNLRMRVLAKNMEKAQERMEASRALRGDRKIGRGYDQSVQTDEPPVFHHEEIQQLYQYGLELDHEILRSILELPRETLVKDLENVLLDSLRRFEFFQNKVEEEGWEEEDMSFSLHALFLLTELRATGSLPAILEHLRQGEDFLEFWYSDHITETAWHTVYHLGQEQLDLLKSFMCESGIAHAGKGAVTQAVVQMALHQPEREGGILEWYEAILDHFLTHLDDAELIDIDVVAPLLANLADLPSKHLLPKIKRFYDLNLVDEFYVGDYESVEKDILERKSFEGKKYDGKHTVFNAVFDHYTKITTTWAGYKTEEQRAAQNAKWEKHLREQDSEKKFRLPPAEPEDGGWPETVKRESPKVGRNEPCPCGSGKKYKKCCLKK